MSTDGDIDIFSPAFVVSGLLITYAFLGIVDYFAGPYPRETVVTALGYLLLFTASLALGLASKFGASMAQRLPRVRCEFSRKRLIILTAVCLTAGIGLFGYLVQKLALGNPLAILSNLLGFRQGSGRAGTEYLLFAAISLIEAPFWAWLVRGRIPAWGRLGLVPYWLLILGVSVLTGARVRVYTAVMGLVYVFHHKKNRISLRRAFIAGALAVVPFALFFQLQGRVRGQVVTKDALATVAQDLQFGRSLGGLAMRFADAFDGFLTIIDNRDRVDYLWGKSFHDALYLPIPRAWLPNKPSAFNYEMLHQLAPENEAVFFGAEYSVLGELYMNFQLVGIVIGGFAFGVLVGMVNRYYLENRNNVGFLFMYRPLFLSLPMAWMTSGIINTEAHSILILNAVFGALFVALARARHGRMWAFRRSRFAPSSPSAPLAATRL